MIDFLKKQRPPSSMLGLSLEGSRLEGVLLRRSNGSFRVQKTFSASLALNPLNADPELVGREIRNHLEQADIHERRCAVCIPLSWALTVQTKIPTLPEEDIASFLQIEAERGFPYGPEALNISTSRYRSAEGDQYATLVGVPRNHALQLDNVLRAARLRPLSFTLGITALQSPAKDSPEGAVTLAITEETVNLQVTCGGGVAALRTLEGVVDSEAGQKSIYADVIARELRITLGQLPVEFRDRVRTVRIFGRGELVQQFANDFTPRAAAMGMHVELPSARSTYAFAKALPPETEISPALSVAAGALMGAKPLFEFLPPKISSWQQLTTRFSSKKLVWAGASAGSVALIVVGAFLIQQWQLSRWGSEWAAMEPKVRELDTMQQQIRQFRPWFDDSFRSLTILRKLTEAFPEDGTVSAKTLEIRDLTSVTCSGTARDSAALLKMFDQLRSKKEIFELKLPQSKGESPLQFTFNFQWAEGGANAN